MVKVVLSIGANCGARKETVGRAISWLREILRDLKSSEIYETPCVGKDGAPYMNAVVSGVYTGGLKELESSLKHYELEKGRTSECRERGEVPLDIDIVMADEKVLKEWDFRQKFFNLGYSEIY